MPYASSADDDQDQDDVLGEAAPLAGHQQVAEAVLGVDQLGQHDVAERQAEQVPQAVVDVGQRERRPAPSARSAAARRPASARSRRSGRARWRSRDAASENTNGTQAMKMNITFCVSSIPNHRIVSGISAATGMLRPKSASGAPAASKTRHEPARMPSGTPTSDGEAEAEQHALQRGGDALQQRALVQQSSGSSPTTSAGLGRITGEISRFSASAPRVASHQQQQRRTRHRRRRRPGGRDQPRRREAEREQSRVSGRRPSDLGAAPPASAG